MKPFLAGTSDPVGAAEAAIGFEGAIVPIAASAAPTQVIT